MTCDSALTHICTRTTLGFDQPWGLGRQGHS